MRKPPRATPAIMGGGPPRMAVAAHAAAVVARWPPGLMTPHHRTACPPPAREAVLYFAIGLTSLEEWLVQLRGRSDFCRVHRRLRRGVARDGLAAPARAPGSREADELRVRG